MKKQIIAILFLTATLPVFAQKPLEKGLQSISEQSEKQVSTFLHPMNWKDAKPEVVAAELPENI